MVSWLLVEFRQVRVRSVTLLWSGPGIRAKYYNFYTIFNQIAKRMSDTPATRAELLAAARTRGDEGEA